MDYEIETVKLQQYIRNYVPTGYKEAIHVFDYEPTITARQFALLKEAHDNKSLDDNQIKTIGLITIGSLTLKTFNRWYVIEAIKKYFNREA